MAQLSPSVLLTKQGAGQLVRAASHSLWRMLSQHVRWPDRISSVAAQPSGSAMPNAEVEWTGEVQGAGKDEFREEMRKTTNVPWKLEGRNLKNRSANLEKHFPASQSRRVYFPAVSGEQLVSLDRVLPTQDRTLSSLAASCFLSKDGCRGSGRAAEGG